MITLGQATWVGSHRTGGQPKHAARKTLHGGDCNRKTQKDTDIANTGGTCLDGKTNCLGTAMATRTGWSRPKTGKNGKAISGILRRVFSGKTARTFSTRPPLPPPPQFKEARIAAFQTQVALGRVEGPNLISPLSPLKPGKLRALKEWLQGLRGKKGQKFQGRRAGGRLGMGNPEGSTPLPTPGRLRIHKSLGNPRKNPRPGRGKRLGAPS